MLTQEEKYQQMALGIFNDLGEAGLRLSARCDRANADWRYQRGDVDFALLLIDRALACEELLERVRRGEVSRQP